MWGIKHQPEGRQNRRSLLSDCGSYALTFLSDVYKKSTRAIKCQAEGLQAGRSMVEMLGVLAIIGVLSIGAIAGYSSAMNKHKINKVIYQLTFFINGIMEHYEEFSRDALADKDTSTSHHAIVPYITALNILPDGIRIKNNETIIDAAGNSFGLFMRTSTGRLVFDYYLETDKTSFNSSLCSALMMNLLRPSHDILDNVWMYRAKESAGSTWYGDKRCSAGKKCLKDITIDEVDSMCHECLEGATCTLTFEI